MDIETHLSHLPRTSKCLIRVQSIFVIYQRSWLPINLSKSVLLFSSLLSKIIRWHASPFYNQNIPFLSIPMFVSITKCVPCRFQQHLGKHRQWKDSRMCARRWRQRALESRIHSNWRCSLPGSCTGVCAVSSRWVQGVTVARSFI